MARKAAIVVGVDRVETLTPLSSAARCAHEVAAWLAGEGYDVECVTDEADPVTSDRVSKAVDRIVTSPPRYHQLVVYFSGHGLWHARTDIWLFSKAPTRTSEGINLDGAIDLARYSGIPNVIFVSDACRSLPDERTAALMKGIDAFPNFSDVDTASRIDVFKATSDAQEAYETEVDGKITSILTHALLAAYVQPTPEMVREVEEGGRTLRVVPNRRLEDFLQAKVDETLAAVKVDLVQRLEVNVPSSDDVYIARVKETEVGEATPGPADTAPPPPAATPAPAGTASLPPAPTPSVERDAASGLSRALSRRGLEHGARLDTLGFEVPETARQIELRLPVASVDHFESGCGFSVTGARIAAAYAPPGANGPSIEVLNVGDGAALPGVVRVDTVGPGTSVLLRFDDSSGAVVAALAGYIGHVAHGPVGVMNVSYVPSSNHWRWPRYKRKRKRLDRLRALAALAADHSAFRLRSDREARRLAKKIRVDKALDPTLGLYAAHAHMQAGDIWGIRSVASYMYSDLGADLFDVHVLAGRPARGDGDERHVAVAEHDELLDAPLEHRARRSAPPHDHPVLPFCPLLTQTWHLLRPRRVELPPVLDKASAFLCNSLWTTFELDGADMIQSALERGELP